jgi:hypothetical protein
MRVTGCRVWPTARARFRRLGRRHDTAAQARLVRRSRHPCILPLCAPSWERPVQGRVRERAHPLLLPRQGIFCSLAFASRSASSISSGGGRRRYRGDPRCAKRADSKNIRAYSKLVCNKIPIFTTNRVNRDNGGEGRKEGRKEEEVNPAAFAGGIQAPRGW